MIYFLVNLHLIIMKIKYNNLCLLSFVFFNNINECNQNDFVISVIRIVYDLWQTLMLIYEHPLMDERIKKNVGDSGLNIIVISFRK